MTESARGEDPRPSSPALSPARLLDRLEALQTEVERLSHLENEVEHLKTVVGDLRREKASLECSLLLLERRLNDVGASRAASSPSFPHAESSLGLRPEDLAESR
jgi:hypothetical protein